MSLTVAIVGEGRMGKGHASRLSAIGDVGITGVTVCWLDAAARQAKSVGANTPSTTAKCLQT